MPRVPRGAAVFIALVIATAGIGAVSFLSLYCPAPSVAIGTQTPVFASLADNGSSDGTYTVHLFAGTHDGTTVVVIEGVKVVLPITGAVFEAGTASLTSGSVSISAAIPNDTSLIGEKVIWIAVIVDPVTHRVIAIARTGGPIIEDAIC